jgi:stage II sporulation protein AA (anti-sigma F factor antagonist)
MGVDGVPSWVRVRSPDESKPMRGGGVVPELVDIRVAVADGRYTVAVSGELDILSAGKLEAVLLEISGDSASALRLDLSELTFMDSTGLRTILLAKELCDSHGFELSLVPGPPKVQRLFEVTALLRVLPFEGDGAGDAAGNGAGIEAVRRHKTVGGQLRRA